MINRLIKSFIFNEDSREDIVFSDPNKIRMNPARNKKLAHSNHRSDETNEERRLSGDYNDPGVELKLNANGYSLDEWIYVRTPITNPKGVNNWTGFDVDIQSPDGTSILYKPGSVINDIEEDYYHDGFTWRLANEETRASGSITIDDYTLLSGTTLYINGYPRKEGEQWFATNDNETTAISIGEDLANFSSIGFERSSNQINLYAKNFGTIGNSITISTNAVGGITLSGPNLSGGSNGEYNTFNEIQQNISTLLDFIINTRNGDKTIYWKANLRTNDNKVTPVIHAIKMLGEFEVEWHEDILYDTILQKFHDNVRFTFDYEIYIPSTTNVLDMSSNEFIPTNEGYNITGIKNVYNMTVDPHKINDIFDSYIPGPLNEDGETYMPGILNLTTNVNTGDILWAKIEVVPEFAVNTGQDFYEVLKYPSVVIENIQNTVDTGSTSNYTSESGRDVVRDFINGTAVEVQPPAVNDLRFEYAIFTSNPIDLSRLIIAMNEYFIENRVIRTNALDEKITIRHFSENDMSQSPDLNDVNTATGVFILRSVPFYIKKSLEVPLVLNLNTMFTST